MASSMVDLFIKQGNASILQYNYSMTTVYNDSVEILIRQKVMPINFSQISKLIHLPRDWIENVLKQIVESFWKVFLKTKKVC